MKYFRLLFEYMMPLLDPEREPILKDLGTSIHAKLPHFESDGLELYEYFNI